ncbi:protein phosphatase 2C 50-like [Phragmites australis]|uniref:protein phosphatase 2C 50-like n=1 Tax=Phragmites australis TaxID=29695 RepID=UPI002D77338B|nr:protein phosphatase 2C 50-like [Phragmites australis]
MYIYAACAPFLEGRAGGTERTDLSARTAAWCGGNRRRTSVYLTECVPAWGCATTCGRGAAMEGACAAVPRFAEVPVRMLAGAREPDALGLGLDAAAALRLPAHLLAVYDGHGGSEVANYCRDRIHVVLRDVLSRAASGLGESGDLDIKEHREKVTSDSFQRVDDEVSGEPSRFPNGVSGVQCKPVAAADVGSNAVVAVVCSSHVIVANRGDSRVVLCCGKKPIALSVHHKSNNGEDECARIEDAGGKVVSGILAMSRSIGKYVASLHAQHPNLTVQFKWMMMSSCIFRDWNEIEINLTSYALV